MSYEQNKISKSARGEPCTGRIPGYCNLDWNTTVLGHAPFSGRFSSRKHWWWSAYLCSGCHDVLDDRDNRMTRLEKDHVWFRAVHKTQERLIGKELLVVVL